MLVLTTLLAVTSLLASALVVNGEASSNDACFAAWTEFLEPFVVTDAGETPDEAMVCPAFEAAGHVRPTIDDVDWYVVPVAGLTQQEASFEAAVNYVDSPGPSAIQVALWWIGEDAILLDEALATGDYYGGDRVVLSGSRGSGDGDFYVSVTWHSGTGATVHYSLYDI